MKPKISKKSTQPQRKKVQNAVDKYQIGQTLDEEESSDDDIISSAKVSPKSESEKNISPKTQTPLTQTPKILTPKISTPRIPTPRVEQTPIRLSVGDFYTKSPGQKSDGSQRSSKLVPTPPQRAV